MSIVRNDAGAIRLVWRVILVILLYVAVAVLLRFIPIKFLAASLIRDGIPQGTALERANTLLLEDPVWIVVIGTASGLMGLVIVWFLMHGVERSKFTWKAVGLDWRRNSPLLILAGALLACLLFIAYLLIGYLLGSSDPSQGASLMRVSIAIIFQRLILYIGMGFGEEVVFRGYVQTRVAARLGVVWGVLVTAVGFTLLHQISYQLSPVTALSGTMLWITIGALYHLSRSLYLVGTLHGVMNLLLNTLNFDITNVGGMVVHALALLILIIVASLAMRQHRLRSSPV